MSNDVTHTHIYIYILVGGFNPSEKYESQLKVSWDDYSQYMENMFQTTNQYEYIYIYIYMHMHMAYLLQYHV